MEKQTEKRSASIKVNMVAPFIVSMLLWAFAATGQSDLTQYDAPQEYQDDWRFVVLSEDDSVAYYGAAQASRRMLYQTLGWGWPTSKQTLESHTDTIQFHVQQHNEGAAYTYVIMEPQHRQLRGALFISRVQNRSDVPGFDAADYQFEITFWLNEAGQSAQHSSRLVANIVQWVRDEWDVESVLFPTSRANIFARNQFEQNNFEMVAEDVNSNELLYRFRAR